MAILKGDWYSDIVLGKVDSSDQGYSFLEMPIAFVAGMKAGMLVTEAGALVAAGTAADAFGVILDRDLLDTVAVDPAYVVGETYNFVVGVQSDPKQVQTCFR